MPDWLSGIVPSELRRRVAARRRRARAEDVEDAVQDVLMGLVQKLRNDRAPAAPLDVRHRFRLIAAMRQHRPERAKVTR